ncbi:phytoene desaturase family protein [Nesterenkonia populi]
MRWRAAVVGSGPNGLVAANRLAQAGAQVTVFETAEAPGGALRSAELFGAGLVSDLGASVHPLTIASPAYDAVLDTAPDWAHPRIPAVHGIDGGCPPAVLHASLEETAAGLGADGPRWEALMGPLVRHWDDVRKSVFAPPSRPFAYQYEDAARLSADVALSERLRRSSFAPLSGAAGVLGRTHALAQLGLRGALPARALDRLFSEERTRALFAGLAGHSASPLSRTMTSAFGVIFGAAAHAGGWPVLRGGSQQLVDSLVEAITARGGRVESGFMVESMVEARLPAGRMGTRKDLRRRGWKLAGTSGSLQRTADEVYDVVVLDLTPAQMLRMDGLDLPGWLRRRFSRWDYGPAVVKVDYLLNGPVPWKHQEMANAGTVHLGGTASQIAAAESAVGRGVLPGRPYVLMAQTGAADEARTPDHRQTMWAYAHVPQGLDASGARRAVRLIEEEIARQAPEFRDVVLERKVWGPEELEEWNPNLVGGTISGGLPTLSQMVARPRPVIPYAAGPDGVYMCSSSTPPGGGAHGMGGYNAAISILKDLELQD